MTSEGNGLVYGPISAGAVHLCVDMQRLFAEQTEWRTPWFSRVLPNVVSLVDHRPEQAIFTRFVPAKHPREGRGTWARYYERWASLTIERTGPDLVDLVLDLARFVPPAAVIDKSVYSPWLSPALDAELKRRKVDALIVSGGETEVCVLSTVLGAVDRGYRVIVATDALCSSADETHDAVLKIYRQRYGQQIEAVTTQEIVNNWD